MSTLGFYRAFEERFYAPRSTIKKLRQQYLPFVQPLAALYPGAATFDIGCGRGEWLELMQELGMSPFGVDLDAGMLQGCHELNLPAEQGDAVAYLQTLADNSQAVVTAFHVVEHISFEQLTKVVIESLRVLQPGGLLIMETPNPENIVVATRNFYLDPTHLRPIPSLLLSFLPEYHGFARVHTLRLQESSALHQCNDISLIDVLGGVSPDYAVVAQKAAAPDVMERFDTVFATQYGIDLNDLAGRYDGTLQRRMVALDQRLAKAEAQAGGMTEALDRIVTSQDHRMVALDQRLTNAEAQAGGMTEALDRIVTSQDHRMVALDQRLTNAEAQAGGMTDALARITTLQDRLLEASTQLACKQAEQEKLQAVANHATEQLQEAQQRAAAAEANSHHWWQQASALDAERNALRQSASWRITAPLRWAGSLVLRPATTARTFANWVICNGIETFQRPLSKLMAYVLRRPQLSCRINQVLLRYPALHQQLVGVAHRAGVVAAVQPTHSVHTLSTAGFVTPELANLTPRARQIYAELQKAIENKKGTD